MKELFKYFIDDLGKHKGKFWKGNYKIMNKIKLPRRKWLDHPLESSPRLKEKEITIYKIPR